MACNTHLNKTYSINILAAPRITEANSIPINM